MMKKLYFLLLGLSLTSCAELTKVGSQIAVQAGVLSSSQAASLQRASEAGAKAFKSDTKEDEYLLGRAVSATLLNTYPASSNDTANRYLNLVGKTLVLNSTEPESYSNYHFLLLDSEEINAFAAPSGFIFVTKGMVKLCQNEDDLAAVLAHEISHVQKSHALKSIKTSRWTSLATTLGNEAIKTWTPSQLGQLVTQFESNIDDVTQTLTNNGYGRRLESKADKAAITLLQTSGYNQEGLLRILERLKEKSSTTQKGFLATHPDTTDRIAEVTDLLKSGATNPLSAVRTKRFNAVFGRL